MLMLLLAVSAGAAYADDGDVPDAGVGDAVLYASNANLAMNPVYTMGCAPCNFGCGPICTSIEIPSACTTPMCAPCLNCAPCFNSCVPCISTCTPSFTGCTIESLAYNKVHSPAALSCVPESVMGNFCDMACPCFAPFANVVVPVNGEIL